MIQIKELVKSMREELSDSEAYIDMALHYKPRDKALADMYKELASQELQHAHMEHAQAERIIGQLNDPNMTKVHESMKAVWDWEHEQMMETEAIIKAKMDMYNAKN